jgi:hypothetical protein
MRAHARELSPAGLTGWAVDIEWIRRSLAQPSETENRAIYATLLPRVTNHLKEVAGTFGLGLDEARGLLHDICLGKYGTGRSAAAYYHVFEGIVALIGRRLPNAAFQPMSRASAAALDDELATIRAVGVTVRQFLGHSLPVGLPSPVDLPRAGFVTEEMVSQVYDAFASVTIRDPTITELRDWFRIAAEHRRGIVAFYY